MQAFERQWRLFVTENSQKPKREVSKVLILDGDKLLLFKRRSDMRHGEKWDFPGGHSEFEESVEESAVREVLEETGLSINEKDLTLIYSSGKTSFFITRDWQGTIKISDEHTDHAWVTDETYQDYDAGALYNKILDRYFNYGRS